ncbi:hypothetical protein [Marinobacter sp.]|uniref:hypothetical protein n=1 Tax=Marinobacter sp. TaxID=50741 RepID=UPI003A8FBA95
MTFKEKISAIKEWYVDTIDASKKFIYAQIAAYIVLFLSLYNYAHKEFVLLIIVCTLVIPFAMIVRILADNLAYSYLSEKMWGKAVIAVVIAIYTAFSAVWASNEINAIFRVGAANLPWATSILTIVYFFKNVVMAFIGSYLALIFFYCIFWIADVLVFSYDGFTNFLKRSVSGVMLVFGLGLASGTAGALTKNGDFFAKYVAVKADFSTSHRCKGIQFNNIDGVLFLPSGSVLIAKQVASEKGRPDWSFDSSSCAM